MRPGEKKYPHVFSPGKLGKMEVKNRIKYASTETNFNYGDGWVADKEVAYMEAQARGGAGMVTTQGAYTDPKGEGQGYVGMMGIWKDDFIPGLKRISDAIHKYDSKAVLQLMHCGRVGGINLDYTAGPSVVPQKLPRFREPIEMTVEMIEECVQQHIDAALRTVEAGFDAVEISGIVGYLLSNFLSSYTNLRTDDFGGTPEKRAEFPRRTVAGIRKAVGDDYPIIIRLCGDELLFDRGGSTPEESMTMNKIILDAGCDCLSVTAGWQESPVSVISRDVEMGHWLYIAEQYKKALPEHITVAMAYRLFLPEFPEAAIAAGNLDFWELCRSMIADPFLPTKIAEDRQEDIIPCMACNQCLARLFRDAELTCMVRPSLGHEREPEYGFYGFPKAEKKKKIAIVGAGIAGLQTAAIAAEKGHDVTVYEAHDKVGGQFEAASHGPWGDKEFMRLVNYLKTRTEKNGGKIVTGKKITKEAAKDLGADKVIFATGAKPDTDIPGADGANVVGYPDILRGADFGKKVAIVGNTGVAISTALFVVDKDPEARVHIIGPGKKFGLDVNPSYIWRFRKKLKEAGVEQHTLSKVKEITASGVTFEAGGEEKSVECDTVILANPVANQDEVVQAKTKEDPDFYTIGDAVWVRRGNSAILDGYRMGMSL
ncbi:MAG: FAD-dependent oxidoreductase [Planctomycetota bacterium]|nr:MAG: FAD-dependent oxidoreductase [Planctomycetota bacterium]